VPHRLVAPLVDVHEWLGEYGISEPRTAFSCTVSLHAV